MRRSILGSGHNGRVLASVLSSSCSLSFKPTLLHEHVHGICDNVLGNLLFLASCHCSSEDVSGKEPRSAVVLPVVLPMVLPVAQAPCCRGHQHRRRFTGCGANPPTLGFELNRIGCVAGPQVPSSAGHWSLRVGWCVPSVVAVSPPGPCQPDLLQLEAGAQLGFSIKDCELLECILLEKG